ncbi:MAG: CvpA family protein [Dysgonamonadaceae bacterium]|jgi:membrane protein required for colicin V production|nr:CvpA family protein [Dysgonamonadaceae bacterium]
MNWFDIVIFICLAAGFVKGLFDGLVKQLAALVALVLAFIFSGQAAEILRNFIENTLHWSMSSAASMNTIYYIIAFLLIVAVFSLLAILVDKLVNVTPAGVLNKLAGGVFGIMLWLLCLSFVLNILSVFDYESKIIDKDIQEKSISYKPVKTALPMVYPYIKEYFKR